MNRRIRIIPFVGKLLCAGALFMASALRAEDIKNPVWPYDWADPTIWQAEDGNYYSVSTNPRFCITSNDLFHWAPYSKVPGGGREDFFSPITKESWDEMRKICHNFWAPDVATVNGKRNLYISLYNSAEDSNIGVLQQCEDGQFHYKGIITSGKVTKIEDTIDPEVITDDETGKVWLFFGSVGGIHRVELTKDGLALKDEYPHYEHVAGLTVHQNHSRNRVYEGCYLHKHDGYWYMFVSSGHYNDHTYKLRVGRSKSLEGTFVDHEGKLMKEGHATTILSSEEGDHFYGPGHCGEIFTAADGNEYIFYHCHVRGSRRPSSRPMLMSRIQWAEDGWPFIEGGKPL